jgi:hypothetical protein
MNYVVSEPDLVETLELLAERHGHPPLRESWDAYLAKTQGQQQGSGQVQVVAQPQALVAPGGGEGGQDQAASEAGSPGARAGSAGGAVPQEPSAVSSPGGSPTQAPTEGGSQQEDAQAAGGGTAGGPVAGSAPGPSSSIRRPPPRRPSGARATVTQREPPEWEPPAGTSLPPGHPLSYIEEGCRRGAACQKCT